MKHLGKILNWKALDPNTWYMVYMVPKPEFDASWVVNRFHASAPLGPIVHIFQGDGTALWFQTYRSRNGIGRQSSHRVIDGEGLDGVAGSGERLRDIESLYELTDDEKCSFLMEWV